MAHSLDNSSSSNNNTINTEAVAAVVDEVADVAVGVGTKLNGMVHQVATSHLYIKAVVDSIVRRLVEVTVTCTLAVAMVASCLEEQTYDLQTIMSSYYDDSF